MLHLRVSRQAADLRKLYVSQPDPITATWRIGLSCSYRIRGKNILAAGRQHPGAKVVTERAVVIITSCEEVTGHQVADQHWVLLSSDVLVF
ncbi:hypothetical protein CCHOA_04540 [Corynebacterium choanae]|uniref:Uncharacterized protein n=1 Tax=Corynebacterium choanae TaxID=1862358 RepID=A0A3G6J5U5_9CORY|nr:hypothetical protein CCHOA_04540 [Corynebacterium choanae]